MRTIARSLIGLAVAFSSLTSVAQAQRTSSDFRRHENFASLKTFTFKERGASARVSAATTTYDSPFVDERTNAAIASELEQRGLTRNDQNPDVYVTTRRTFKTEYTVYGGYGYGGSPWGLYDIGPAWSRTGYYGTGWGGYYGTGWGGWGGWGPTYVDETIRGTLVVDLESAENGELIWRGIGTKHVHENSKPSSRARRVVKEVDNIFKDFPPSGRQ